MSARFTRSASLSLSGIALTLSLAGAAHADAADDKRAESLFSEGRTAMSQGDYASACTKFAESLKLTSRPSVTLNLAACEEHEGRLVSALDHWKKGAAGLPPKDERLDLATSHASALEKRVAHVTLKLPADSPSGARVSLDGADLDIATLGSDHAVDPGKHTLAITAPGRADHNETFTLAESERKEIPLSLGESQTAPPIATTPTTPTPPPPASNKRTLGFVLGGIGIAGLVVGGVTGGVLLSRDSTIKNDCPDKRCNQEGLDTISGSKSLIVVNAIAFGAGVVGVGLGAYFVFTNKGSSTTSVGTTVLPGGGGFTLRQQF